MKEQKIRPELVDELLGGATTQEAIFGPDGVLKRMTAAIVERALGAELAHHLAQPREGATDGNRRNGTSAKTVQTAQGPVALAVPRDRAGTFDPRLVPKHVRRLTGFNDQVLALYARGMSNRDIQRFMLDLYGTEVSHDLITRVTEAVWEELTTWQNRPLERLYTVVWLDALVVKMRAHGVVQNRAVYVAIGLRLDGRKEVLGLWIDGSEGAKFWLRVLSELRSRGVQDVLFVCCDGLKGFPQAIEAVFGQAIVQTCIVHQVRHSLSFVGYQERAKVAADLRPIYTAPSEAAAQAALDAFDGTWSARYPAIVPSWRANWAALTPFLAFPPEIRRMIYTTNAIESLNYQLRKVLKTKGHFPDEDATLKVLFLALQNVAQNWKMPINHWHRIYNQLIAYFGVERLKA